MTITNSGAAAFVLPGVGTLPTLGRRHPAGGGRATHKIFSFQRSTGTGYFDPPRIVPQEGG